MIQSMTGFGKQSIIIGNRKITIEIKSLNSKQLDLSIKLPQSYRQIEPALRSRVANTLKRGKIDLFIYQEPIEGVATYSLNTTLLHSYKQQVTSLAQELKIDPPQDWYSVLLRMPEAFKSEITSQDLAKDEEQAVEQACDQALSGLVAFREQEGHRLYTFFEEKIDAIQALLDQVPQYEAERINKVKTKLMEGLGHLKDVTYDPGRLEQELVFYIEKLDVTEEKLRLHNHLVYFIETLNNGSDQGKKLGFIAQEMGREINTLGSKANHTEIQKLVVQMKDHLEQIKEQVLNVL